MSAEATGHGYFAFGTGQMVDDEMFIGRIGIEAGFDRIQFRIFQGGDIFRDPVHQFTYLFFSYVAVHSIRICGITGVVPGEFQSRGWAEFSGVQRGETIKGTGLVRFSDQPTTEFSGGEMFDLIRLCPAHDLSCYCNCSCKAGTALESQGPALMMSLSAVYVASDVWTDTPLGVSSHEIMGSYS